MKKLAYFAVVLTLGMACLPVLAAEVGSAAPDFSATDISGEPFKLSDHKGSIVVLEWTNPECPFVHKHYDSGNMQKTQQDAEANGVYWVSINSAAPGQQGNLTAEEAQKIIAARNAHSNTEILDPTGEIGHLYDAKTTPHMFVIDKDGNLAYEGAIDDQPTPDPASIAGAKNYVLAAINDLNAGKKVAMPVTQSYGCGVKYAPEK